MSATLLRRSPRCLTSLPLPLQRQPVRHATSVVSGGSSGSVVVTPTGSPAPVAALPPPAYPQPKPREEKKKGGRVRAFLLGTTVGASLVAALGYGYIRADLLALTTDLEDQLLPVAAGLKQDVSRLDQRIKELEKDRK